MPNRLANSKSPYLLQHQDNPVDWYEWGPEAFETAKRRDVPVLLSVGYSACHWCHVMAHESFEDPATAEVMNQRFVNVKVDREERPDVDSIYMEAVQAMTGRGGWPMTVFLTPDKEPFFAGTYFPKQSQHGMASFGQVMEAVSQAWETDREKVIAQAEQLVGAVTRAVPRGEPIGEETLDQAYRSIERQFDTTFGGFGGAPKFPQQPVLDFLLRVRSRHPGADDMLATTLTRMADGGIHDQLGGGFARYSVDNRWLVPHFEKMLYDNAQLARIYLWAGVELDNARFLDVARSTLDYLLDDLRHDEGGFFSAEDADSEGEEGTFYVWGIEELQQALGEDAAEAIAYYGATPGGNFEGKNILHLSPDRPRPNRIDEINSALTEYRNQRVRPGLDDKVIASWNGLAIRALAEAGAVLDEPRYLEAARTASSFVRTNMITSDRVFRSWKDGEVSGPGFIDDHAGLAVGLYVLYAATGETGWFETAQSLVSSFSHFAKDDGGYYTTASDAEELIKRPDDLMDNPLPSGNSLAAEALLLSSLLTGDLDRRSEATAALGSAGLLAERYPSMVAHHLSVAASISAGTKELAIVGPDRAAMAGAYWSAYRPAIALAQSSSADADVPLLAERLAPEQGALGYVCRDFVCELPTDSPQTLLQQLEA